ncbi:MAG: DNA gyrase subunit A [Kiritimatiellae bacterium]|nr:DNA gyrase subunit A [Kiritimatiellia bacterium]
MSDPKDSPGDAPASDSATPVEAAVQPAAAPVGNVARINIEDEMSSSYIDYSMSVIIGRALPDARDGLKPVHRRVLFAMQELGNTHTKPYKKSARVVGDVIGKYHPHGDQAVYDTIVRMAQDFSMRYLLVDGQGNFGSVDGDPPAAMRYTEVRMDRMAEEMLEDLDKETVDFGPNYDESLTQPLVLPAKLPNLLLNGSTGIAVGMATNIPPHNLNELADGIVHYIDNRDCSVDDLMRYVRGPDFPTGATICGTRQIEAMYKLGRGQLTVRGRAEIVEEKNREVIIVSELPYAVNKANWIADVARMVNDKAMEGISDIRDESSSKGIRVVIELKRGAIGQVVLNNLFKHSQLQTTFGAIMLAIDNNRPKVMNLKELIRCYVDHRFDVITRRTHFELARAEARQHILEGLLKALDHLDEIVRLIRAARGRDEARAALIARFAFSERQTDAILEMRLYQLTGLEREKVEAEHKAVGERIVYLRGLLANPELVFGLIKSDLAELKQKYGDERRTEIVPVEGEVDIEDLIADAPCVVTLSHKGYIKRVPLDTYREQRRGGRGVMGGATREEDFIETFFVANTHDTLLFFTNLGRVHAKRAFEVPEAARTATGKAIVNLLELQENEKTATLLRIREFREDQHIMFATARGTVKKTNLSDYRNIRRNGIIAINIEDDDRLIQVCLTGGSDQVMLATAHGQTIRFAEEQVRSTGRDSTGVRGIELEGDDQVCNLTVVDPEATFMIATANGYGKRTEFGEFREQNRGGKGIIGIQTTERNGLVVAAGAVKEDDALMLMTANGMMVRTPVDQVRVIGRNTQGVRLINLDEGDTLLEAIVVPAEPNGDDEDGAVEND